MQNGRGVEGSEITEVDSLSPIVDAYKGDICHLEWQ